MNLTVSEKKHPQIDLLKLVQLILFGSLLLYFGKPLLVPLSFAMLISFLLYPVCKWLEKRGINRIIAILISVSMLVVLVGAVVYLLLTQLIAFAGYWDEIKTKFISSVHSASVYIADQFGITMLKQQQWLENLTEETSLKIIPFIKNTFMSLSVTLVLIILIPVFSALILINRHLFVRMLFNFFPRQGHRKILSMLRLTITAYYNFIRGMIIVYLTVGILNSIGFAIIGIPSPILFGFIASVLTFIPFVGIIISSLLPITLSWLLYNSVLYPLGVIVVLTIVQILEA